MDLIAIVAVVTFGPVIGYTLLAQYRLSRGKPAIAPGDLLLTVLIAVPLLLIVNLSILQWLVTFAVVSIGLLAGARPRWILAGCWTAALIPVCLAAFNSAALIAQVYELRERYPLVSISEKLNYEQKKHSNEKGHVEPAIAEGVNSRLPLIVLERLAQQEEWTSYSQRESALSRIHSNYAERFVLAAGFGVGRMGGIRKMFIAMPEGEPSSIPMRAAGITSDQQSLEPAVSEEIIPKPSLRSVSEDAERDFLDPERYGFRADGRVAGFIGHRFSEEVGLTGIDRGESDEWEAARVELVSLLKFQQPAVYLSDELPNMQRLANVPTRPLNEFEREALAKLQTEEDLVVRYSANTIRMLGSLRAGKTCLDCHTVQRGALLGAFSYELRRTTPVPAPAPQPAKVKPEA